MKALLISVLFIFTLQAAPHYDTVSVSHKYYTAAYDTNLRYPVIVRWTATQQMLTCTGRLARHEKFTPDPTWPAQTDNDVSYKKSGYDKGHNMPAFDNECSQTGNNECYYFTNITPQTPNLNRGIWKKLEDYGMFESVVVRSAP